MTKGSLLKGSRDPFQSTVPGRDGRWLPWPKFLSIPQTLQKELFLPSYTQWPLMSPLHPEAFAGPHSSPVSAHLRRQSEVAAREGKRLVRAEDNREGLDLSLVGPAALH